ncbi:MAG: ABC transporter ATP-binding protein [Pseudomonadota bacterium]
MFIVATFLETFMVAAVLPFLTVIAAPHASEGSGRLAQVMELLGVAPGYQTTMALGLIALTAILLAGIGGLVRTYWTRSFSTRITVVTSARVFSVQLRQPYAFFLDRHSGELSNLVLNEAPQVVDLFFLPALNCISSFMTVAALVLLVSFVDPVIAVSSFVLLGGIYAASYLSSHKLIRKLSKQRIGANEDSARTVIEAFGGIKEIKLSGHEGGYLGRYMSSSGRMAHAMTYINVVSETPRVIVETAAFSGIILFCLIILSRQDTDAAVSSLLPTMGVFAFAGQRLLPALGQVYTNATRLRSGGAIVVRLARELALSDHPLATDLPQPEPLPLRRELRLEGVSFTFAKATRPSLHDLSVTINAGERIGIVGLTGAGKTTLVDLILGLLQPQTGQITVDGLPLDASTCPGWQRSLGYVPQDIFLKEGSILENIAFGVERDRIDRNRAIECAHLAQIDDLMISLLPAKWDSMVGERGTRLSGGQRQRIGIARALYARASLLVFDEATSALDGLTEIEVMKAINSLDAKQTILLIAHRLSTLRDCDRILLLDRGRLAGFDNWDNLMASSEPFRRMVEAAGLSSSGLIEAADAASLPSDAS